ncbi:MAG: putative rRNA maturation factor [Acidimicrobiaceae bacterium]|nr:putative rRNA maturation factor [Acidimicrobiaceae bacterium]
MGIEVFVADEQNDQPVDTMRWVRLAELVLLEEGVPGDAELSMLFVDEEAMTDLNKRFLGKDSPTDVLAFPIDEEPVEGGRSPDSGGTGPGDTSEPSDMPTVLGDVVICPSVAHRNAPEHAGTYDDEVALLIVHGLLHLLGMDHEDDEEAEAMEEREQALLTTFHRPPKPATADSSDEPVESVEPVGSVPVVEGAPALREGAPALGEAQAQAQAPVPASPDS